MGARPQFSTQNGFLVTNLMKIKLLHAASSASFFLLQPSVLYLWNLERLRCRRFQSASRQLVFILVNKERNSPSHFAWSYRSQWWHQWGTSWYFLLAWSGWVRQMWALLEPGQVRVSSCFLPFQSVYAVRVTFLPLVALEYIGQYRGLYKCAELILIS